MIQENNQNSQTKNIKNEYTYSSERRSNEPVYAVNYDDPNADEYEYEYESDKIPEATTIFDTQGSEFEYETEGESSSTNTYANYSSETEYETEYESEDGKPINVQKNYSTVSSPIKTQRAINKNSSGIKVITKVQSSGIKKIVSNETKAPIDIKKPSKETHEVIRTKRGYIKYRKDEQAVVDREGNILIPYGKHEIIRFKAGFARVKLKDDVEIKNIVCENSNEEFNWSARIYENPWHETVIDEKGVFVNKVIKKVEIYIVDNVNNIPNSELSPSILKIYKDPNPFKGTDQISAFNLWNRENSNTPSVIQKRSEIERLKKVSKNEAFAGAEECRDQISIHFEEVYKYYEDMGYEIILKD